MLGDLIWAAHSNWTNGPWPWICSKVLEWKRKESSPSSKSSLPLLVIQRVYNFLHSHYGHGQRAPQSSFWVSQTLGWNADPSQCWIHSSFSNPAAGSFTDIPLLHITIESAQVNKENFISPTPTPVRGWNKKRQILTTRRFTLFPFLVTSQSTGSVGVG